MSVYGYVRVSTVEQNETRQVRQLEAITDKLFIDKVSGKSFNRPKYKEMIDQLKENDLIVICSIDRLGRNYEEILKQWEYITQEKKANIKVLDMPLLDTSTDTNSLDRTFISRLVLEILGYVAQKEREAIKKRQKEGIEAMQIVNGKRIGKTGKPMGRPKKELTTHDKYIIKKAKEGKITVVQACKELNMSRGTYYSIVKGC